MSVPILLREPDNSDEVLDLDVLNWRYEELARAGYPADVAIALSARQAVDLHEACSLLARGATLEQALRILL